MMSSQPYVLVIDEYSIIAQGCQLRFAQAGLPWTVRWVPSLHTADGQLVPELGAADGHPAPDLAILELRLADGSHGQHPRAEQALHPGGRPHLER